MMGGPGGNVPPWQMGGPPPRFMQGPPPGMGANMPPMNLGMNQQQSGMPPSSGSSGPPQPLMMSSHEPTGLLKEKHDLEREEEEINQKIKDSENNLQQQEEVRVFVF